VVKKGRMQKRQQNLQERVIRCRQQTVEPVGGQQRNIRNRS
jgi:hypothetical protein